MSSLDVIKKILIHEMNIKGNRIWAYNANIDLPTDNNLFIVLSYAEKTPYSNNTRYVPTDDGLNEVQTMNVAEDIIISLISKNTDARDRSYEVLMALNSTYAQQLQVQNKLHISRIGQVLDNSFLEATARLNRFDINCRVLTAYDKIKEVDYYDTYSANLWIKNGNLRKVEVTENTTTTEMNDTLEGLKYKIIGE